MNPNNIVMRETLQDSADWDCFKILILQEILRIQNLHQVEHCALSDATRSCQLVEVQETGHQFHTVQKKLKLFLSMQTHGWNSSSWSLGFGFWSVSFFTKPSNSTTPKIKYEEIRRVTPHQWSTPKTKPSFQPSTTILIRVTLIMFRRTRSLLDLVRCCSFVRTTKQCFKWSSKAEVQQWDTYPEPTELLLTGFWQNQFEPQNSN